jgi:NAD(P)-dependent dehydrogenase (short-subunit alcohol dehydrogenase family)
VVVITGASSGIGEALAYEFSALGSNVVLAARNEEKLAEITSCISSKGGTTLVVTCDVSREEDCRRLIDETTKAFGGIDVLICNAGISMRAVLDDVDTEVLRRLMNVNFWGTVYCTKYALPWLQKSRGSVVGV